MRGGDVLPDHRGPLALFRGQAGEQGIGGLLGFVELAGLEVGGDAEGVEPVPVQELRPWPVFVRVGDAERLLGRAPGFQRLRLVAHDRAFFRVAGGDPGGRGRGGLGGNVLQGLGQQDAGAAVGAVGAGDVAAVGQGARGHRRVAGLPGRRDGGVVQVPGRAGVAEAGRGPAGQQAALSRRDDQAAAQVVLRVAGRPGEQGADLPQVRGQDLEHGLGRDDLLQQVETGRPGFHLPDQGLVDRAGPGQRVGQALPDVRVQDRGRAELRRQREQVPASHGCPVPPHGLGEQLQIDHVGRDSCYRAASRPGPGRRSVSGQAEGLAQRQRHAQAVSQLLKGRSELGGVHTPLVIAQGALREAGPGGDLALGDSACVQDADHRARIAPLARLIEVLTCEDSGQLRAQYVLWFGHDARPVPWGRPA